MKKNNVNQKKLADKLKTSPQNVSRWLSGAVLPRSDMIHRIAACFGVEIQDLLEESGNVRYDSSCLIPVFKSVSAKCGLQSSNRIKEIKVDKGLISNYGESLFGFRVPDDKMENSGILCGDIVLIAKEKEYGDGSIVLASINSQNYSLFRFRQAGDVVVLHNEKSPVFPVVFEPAGGNSFKILGVAVSLIRNFK